MLYFKTQPAGQGVASATKEQINLLKETTGDVFEIHENGRKDGDINHYHQVGLHQYIRMRRGASKEDGPVSVVHVHFLPDTLDGSIKLWDPFMKVFKRYVIDFYKRCDYAVVVNAIFKKPLMELGIPEDHIKYIPNYVSKKHFHEQSAEEQAETRRRHGFSKDDFVVLGVGQVQTRKGVLDFIKVAERCPDYKFIWAGGFSFGNITDGYNELKKQVENPPANVKFLGIVPREEMNALYNMANVMFLPSFKELFPMAILEACNTKIPLLLRNLDLYKDILFGKYLSGNSVDDFVSLLHQLKDDPETALNSSEMSAEISAFYSKENVSAQWVDFYKKIYAARNKSKDA